MTHFMTYTFTPSIEGFEIITQNETGNQLALRGAITPWNITDELFEKMYSIIQAKK